MKLTALFLSAAMICPMAGRSQDNLVKATDPAISYMGRTYVTPDSTVRFNYPGVTAMLNFSGPSLRMLTNPGSGYWMVEVDSLPAFKYHIAPQDSVMIVADGLSKDPHSARITYCIEGFEFNPEIRGFLLADDGKLGNAPAKGNLKIEFIGNSITCGYGTEAQSEKERFSYDTENHTLGYAYLTARELGADFNMVCRSGIGIYRNFGGKAEGDSLGIMPLEYDNTMLYNHDVPWDFSRFSPDIVCVNLGTNDTYRSDYRLDLIENNFNELVTRIQSRHPDAKILLLTGSMMNGKPLEDIRSVLDNVAKSHKEVYRFDFTPQDGSLGYGADYHPSTAQARKMADELIPVIRNLSR